MKNGLIPLPYYVGKTSKEFKKECFASHKIEKYTEILGQKGIPFMYFIYTDCNVNDIIDSLEYEMIIYAIKKKIF